MWNCPCTGQVQPIMLWHSTINQYVAFSQVLLLWFSRMVRLWLITSFFFWFWLFQPEFKMLLNKSVSCQWSQINNVSLPVFQKCNYKMHFYKSALLWCHTRENIHTSQVLVPASEAASLVFVPFQILCGRSNDAKVSAGSCKQRAKIFLFFGDSCFIHTIIIVIIIIYYWMTEPVRPLDRSRIKKQIPECNNTLKQKYFLAAGCTGHPAEISYH